MNSHDLMFWALAVFASIGVIATACALMFILAALRASSRSGGTSSASPTSEPQLHPAEIERNAAWAARNQRLNHYRSTLPEPPRRGDGLKDFLGIIIFALLFVFACIAL